MISLIPGKTHVVVSDACPVILEKEWEAARPVFVVEVVEYLSLSDREPTIAPGVFNPPAPNPAIRERDQLLRRTVVENLLVDLVL